MDKSRMLAFTDGVMAIIITIMVLEIKLPAGAGLADLMPLAPIFFGYVLSFFYIGIYWNNHHHLMHAVHHIDGRALWANHHLLFWLSLVPFVTWWLGQTGFAAVPVALYGAVLLMAALAYYILVRQLLHSHLPDSALARAIGSDAKGKVSLLIYAAGIALCFVHPAIAVALYMAVALIWVVPDRRIERALKV